MNLEQDYDFNAENGVWIKKNARPFLYSDGDKVETDIGKILASVQDKSVMSDELRMEQKNWASTYYFSANRASLLKPLAKKLLLGATVLELGCGMGAVTRYLGETAAQVVAVEGSARRGKNAALRCSDLPNVSVLIDEIGALPESLGKFDVVTLIGVLEYARRYGGPGAEQRLLERAASFLKPDGRLVLAIENKLGLKYLSGVPEDHLGLRWLGVTNGYRETGVATWSRAELLDMLKKAGFERIEQFLALPDYKLPTTIVTPAGLAAEQAEFDMRPILDNCKRAFEDDGAFNLPEAWQSVATAGLVPDLADSLCFVASKNPDSESSFIDGEFAIHYGQRSRMPAKYAKEVSIKKGDCGTCVERHRESQEPSSSLDIFYQELADEPYFHGELLSSSVRRLVMRKDWTLDEFFTALKPWWETLLSNADENWLCDGKLLDYAPFNLIIDKAAKPHAFDQEWIARKKVPVGWLLYRGLHHATLRMKPMRKSHAHDVETFVQLFDAFMNMLNLPETVPTSPDYLWWQEAKFIKFIYNNPNILPAKDFNLYY